MGTLAAVRSVSSPALAILQGSQVPHALLCELQFDSGTLYLASGSLNLTHAGHTWQAIGEFGGVQQLQDSPNDAPELRFSLSGVPSTQIGLALAEPVRNRPVYLSLAVLDPSTGAIEEVLDLWSGTLDQMAISHGADGQCSIGVTALHAAATLRRPKPLRYTDADQQRLYPGDTCLRFLPSQANHQDVWPAAAWGRQ